MTKTIYIEKDNSLSADCDNNFNILISENKVTSITFFVIIKKVVKC